MLGLCDELANHCLDDADVAVEKSTYGSSEQCNPHVGGEAYHDHTEHGSHTSQHQDRLAADSIREAAPIHAHEGLGEGEGRDEQASVEGGILLAADLELFDQSPGIGKDGSQSDGLGKANNGCSQVLVSAIKQPAHSGGTYPAGRVGELESHQGCESASAWLGSWLLHKARAYDSKTRARSW